ncbi:hypothetical protein ACGFW5_30980 [Streptomyces sp. NPDC048416]|uniref:hypothetical protein n=1 Tax=Streptomyces sp. NPDC048416 TaxID=3365546 RepID=UPI0037206121
MKVRADAAELLRAGVPQIHVARTLHMSPVTVQRTREALGLPAPRSCRVLPTSLKDAFTQHTTPVEGGHLHWSGWHRAGNRPEMGYGGRRYLGYPVAFQIRWGRAPVGHVRPGCGDDGCIAPDHVEDRPMREQNRALYRAIFGSLP